MSKAACRTLLATALLALVSAGCASPAGPARGVDDEIAPLAADAAPPPAEQAPDLVFRALNYIGVRYRRGGNGGDEGFDCSGFTRHVVESVLGLQLPRRADEQARAAGLAPVRLAELQPGDLVFFNTLRRAFSHVGIYVGDGKFVHAPRPGTEVRVEDMRLGYWTKRFDGARRVPAAQAAASRP